jgi:hypothetical protein
MLKLLAFNKEKERDGCEIEHENGAITNACRHS